MPNNNDSDVTGDMASLIAAGFVLLIGYGIYKILESFGGFEKGQEVSSDEFETTFNRGDFSNQTISEPARCETESEATHAAVEEEYCQKCGTYKPDRCYCGNCMICYGDSGGECNSCSSD